MKRLVVLCAVALAFAGCFDFDAAYEAYCDGGRCGAGGGTGGGGDDGGTGGGTGGGAMGGGGGAMGGGSGGGGGAMGGGAGGGAMGGGAGGGAMGGGGGTDAGTPDAGTPDAGCPSFLCPVDIAQLPRESYRSSYWTVAPGVIAPSLDLFHVWTSYDIVPTSTDDYDHYEYLKFDGGFIEIDRTLDFGPAFEAQVSKGTLADRWTGTRGYIRHYVNDVPAEGYTECTKADGGGVNDPWWYGVEVLSPTDVLFVGYPATVCRWTPGNGLVELFDGEAFAGSVYFYDAHRTASGNEYVVGGEYVNNAATSAIFFSNGIAASAPNDIDSNTDNGWNEIDGVGDDAWVVSGSGMIARLMPDAGFEQVFDAGFALRSIDVHSATDVWAVGSNGSRAAHFDGGSWGVVTLPSSAFSPSIVWERVVVTDDGAGLVLSGYVRNGTPATLKGVVHSYRRQGK